MATTSASWTIHRNGSRKTIQSQRHWPNQVSRSQILGIEIRLVEICLAQEVTILDFWVQLLSFFWDAKKGEWMAFPCVVPTVKNWWAALMVDRWVGGFSGESKHTFGLCKGYIHPRMPNWDGMDYKRKSSWQVLSICGNSLNKHFRWWPHDAGKDVANIVQRCYQS